MNIFKRLKIFQKLIIVFMIVILFMSAIGLSGYIYLKNIYGDLESISLSYLPSLDYIIQTDRDLQQLLVAERSMIYLNPESDIFNKLLKDYEDNFKQSNERWNKFKSIQYSKEICKYCSDYEKARDEWYAISQQIVNGKKDNSREGRRLAIDLSTGIAADKFEQMRDYLNKLTEIIESDADRAKKTAFESYQWAINTFIAILIVGIVTSFFLAVIISRSIIIPVKSAVEGLKDIAQGKGDLTRKLEVNTSDEIGELSNWFNIFIEQLRLLISDVLSNTLSLLRTSSELNALSDHILKRSGNVLEKSEFTVSAAEEMRLNIDHVAAAMEETSGNVNMVASASNQIASSIEAIATNSEKARSLTTHAVEQVNKTSVKINELGNAAFDIGKVTEAISEISEQTNLLALNATIEAARAGDAGKGFAVVASEIKLLARQTEDATVDIKNKISSIQIITTESVNEIEEVSKTINSVDSMVQSIALAADEQSVATRDISSNVVSASRGINEVTEKTAHSSELSGNIAHNIAEVNHSAKELSLSSKEVNSSTSALNKLVETLKSLIGRFQI